MRKIEFRGFDYENGAWRHGSLIQYPNGDCIIVEFDTDGNELSYDVDPSTVEQFTGVTDMDNEPIYEGDIVERYGDRGTIIFQDGCFSVDWEDSTNTLFWYASDNLSMDLEVIGNIHDNKDLLK